MNMCHIYIYIFRCNLSLYFLRIFYDCNMNLLIDCAEWSFVGDEVPDEIADPKSKRIKNILNRK